MNTEKKLEYFTKAISNGIEAKKRKTRQQMATDMNEAIAQAISQAEAEASQQIAAETQTAQKANNKHISEANSKARRALAALHGQLTTQLFDEVKTEVIIFTHSREYENILMDSIQAALAQTKHIFTYIQLPPINLHMGPKIQEVTGLTPEPGPESDIGGFKLLSANRNMEADNTFKSRLAGALEAFYEIFPPI